MNRFISGIVNINGEIKICYSLSELLELSHVDDVDKEEKNKPGRLVVIELDEIQYVFFVDEVKGLYWYGDADLLPVPATLNAENTFLLSGSINRFNQQVAIFGLKKFQEKLEGTML